MLEKWQHPWLPHPRWENVVTLPTGISSATALAFSLHGVTMIELVITGNLAKGLDHRRGHTIASEDNATNHVQIKH